MAEVLQLPKRPKSEGKTTKATGFADAVADPQVRAALHALQENDEYLAHVAKLNLMEVFERLETLEAIVFAPGVLIAELRGQPLTAKQRAQMFGVLNRKGKKTSEVE